MLQYHREIQDWFAHGSVMTVFMKGRIEEFYKTYNARLEKIGREITELQKQYYVYEDDKMKIVEGKGILLDGKEEKDAITSYQALLDQQISESITTLQKPIILVS